MTYLRMAMTYRWEEKLRILKKKTPRKLVDAVKDAETYLMYC